MHSTDKPWKCDECNYAHAVKAGLTEHKKYAHAKESDMIVCHLCTHQTPNKNEMKQHIATVHQKIKRFTCDECARQFYHNNQLQKHIAGNFVSHCNLLSTLFTAMDVADQQPRGPTLQYVGQFLSTFKV